MSDDLIQLWDKGVLLQGIWETIYLTFISSFIAYVFGLPIGVLLTVTDKDGIHPIPWLNKTIGILVNIFRSIPFIILMVACLPAAKVIACVICGMQRSRIQSGTLRKMPLPCRQDRLPELRSTAVPENAWYAAFHR